MKDKWKLSPGLALISITHNQLSCVTSHSLQFGHFHYSPYADIQSPIIIHMSLLVFMSEIKINLTPENIYIKEFPENHLFYINWLSSRGYFVIEIQAYKFIHAG